MKANLWLSLFLVLCVVSPQVSTKNVIGFWPNWVSQDVSFIRFDVVTHAVWAFIIPNADASIPSLSSKDDQQMKSMVSLAHSHKRLAGVSMGGWGAVDNLVAATSTSSLRQTLVNNLVSFLNKYNLDLVDIDWEFVLSPTASQFSQFMQLLYTTVHPMGKVVSADLPDDDYYGQYIPSSAFQYADIWNSMCYYADTVKPGDHPSSLNYSISSMNYWKSRVSASKLTMGVPFFGQTYILGKTDGLEVDYSVIVSKYNPSVNADSLALSSTDTLYWNNPGDVSDKTSYVVGSSYNGLMIWDLAEDTSNNSTSLINAIGKAL